MEEFTKLLKTLKFNSWAIRQEPNVTPKAVGSAGEDLTTESQSHRESRETIEPCDGYLGSGYAY